MASGDGWVGTSTNLSVRHPVATRHGLTPGQPISSSDLPLVSFTKRSTKGTDSAAKTA